MTSKEKTNVSPAMDEMTLRDYFAAAALNGLYAADVKDEYSIRTAVESAYGTADAMLRERLLDSDEVESPSGPYPRGELSTNTFM